MIYHLSARNVHMAIPRLAHGLTVFGDARNSRVGRAIEISPAVITLERPQERFHVVPHRNANPFAQIAETMWVLAGRNDVEWLSRYLPRAKDFSDDGITWRAGYGPRLRGWHRTDGETGLEGDQLVAVCEHLRGSPDSRRAVIGIWDPSQEIGANGAFLTSKDFPCNDLIQFYLQANGKLDMFVTVRSNDFLWGFSGINTFEWSVLHELMASSVNVPMGEVTFFVGSFHAYDHQGHLERIRKIAKLQSVANPYYDHGFSADATTIKSFHTLDTVLQRCFAVEAQLRALPTEPTYEQIMACGLDSSQAISDPLFGDFMMMLRLYNAFLQGANGTVIGQLIAELPRTSDIRIAALEYFNRTWKSTPSTFALFPEEEAFFASLYSDGPTPPGQGG
jgi:thymidylate synthase